MADVYPTLKVETALTTTPFSASPNWVDISPYLICSNQHPLTISRGRSHETDTIQPGALSFTLRNDDGRFTADLATSPHYPNVKIFRRVRVQGTLGGVTETLFDGHVNAWPLQWDQLVAYGRARITATDALTLAARRKLRSLYEHEILADAPAYYWTLADPSGASFAAESSGKSGAELAVKTKGTGATLEFGSGTGPGVDGLSAPQWTSGPDGRFEDYLYLEGTPTAPVPTSGAPSVSYEVSFATSVAQSTPSMGLLGAMRAASADVFFSLYLDSADGTLVARWAQTQTNGTVVVRSIRSTGYDVWDGRTHHAIFRITDDFGADTTEGTLYVDGVQRANATHTGGTHGTAAGAGRLDVGAAIAGTGEWRGFDGTISHVAVFPIGLTLGGGKVTAHYQAWQGWPDQTTDTRLTKIAGYWGYHTTAFAAGDSTLAGQATAGSTVRDALDMAAINSEDGLVFIDRAGALRFHNRWHRVNRAVSFTVSASSQVGKNLALDYDLTHVRNEAKVTKQSRGGAGGQEVVVSDQGSIDDYDVQSESIDTVLPASELTYRAQAVVDRAAQPRHRVGAVPVLPTDLALGRTLLALEVGDAFAVSGMPANAPTSTMEFDVEGVGHEFRGREWLLTARTSPRPSKNYAVVGEGTTSTLGDSLYVGW